MSRHDRKSNPRPRCGAQRCKLCVSSSCCLRDYIETVSIVVNKKPHPTIRLIPYSTIDPIITLTATPSALLFLLPLSSLLPQQIPFRLRPPPLRLFMTILPTSITLRLSTAYLLALNRSSMLLARIPIHLPTSSTLSISLQLCALRLLELTKSLTLNITNSTPMTKVSYALSLA